MPDSAVMRLIAGGAALRPCGSRGALWAGTYGTGDTGAASKRRERYRECACGQSPAGSPGLGARPPRRRVARGGCACPFRLRRSPVRAGDPRGRAAGRRRGPGALHQLRRPAAAPAAANQAGAGQGAGQVGGGAAPGSYPGTNTAEAGAGEPDLVKTDGRRIVTVTGGVLRVVDAGTQQLTGVLDLSPGAGLDGATPANLLLSGDHALVLFDQGYPVVGAPVPDTTQQVSPSDAGGPIQAGGTPGAGRSAGPGAPGAGPAVGAQ